MQFPEALLQRVHRYTLIVSTHGMRSGTGCRACALPMTIDPGCRWLRQWTACASNRDLFMSCDFDRLYAWKEVLVHSVHTSASGSSEELLHMLVYLGCIVRSATFRRLSRERAVSLSAKMRTTHQQFSDVAVFVSLTMQALLSLSTSGQSEKALTDASGVVQQDTMESDRSCDVLVQQLCEIVTSGLANLHSDHADSVTDAVHAAIDSLVAGTSIALSTFSNSSGLNGASLSSEPSVSLHTFVGVARSFADSEHGFTLLCSAAASSPTNSGLSFCEVLARLTVSIMRQAAACASSASVCESWWRLSEDALFSVSQCLMTIDHAVQPATCHDLLDALLLTNEKLGTAGAVTIVELTSLLQCRPSQCQLNRNCHDRSRQVLGGVLQRYVLHATGHGDSIIAGLIQTLSSCVPCVADLALCILPQCYQR